MAVIADHGTARSVTHPRVTSGENSPPRSLAEAVRRVIRSTGNVDLLAMETGLPRRSLYHWATDPENPSGDHRGSMPLSAVIPLTLRTGDYSIVSRISAECGGVFVLLPDVADAPLATRACVERLSEVITESAEVQLEFARSIGDGHVSRDDAERIAAEGHEAIAAIHRLIVEVQRAAEHDEPERMPLAKAGRKAGGR